jgi:hypothetical protein
VAVASVALAALPPGGTFVDDNGHVFEPAIEAVAAEGITKGCNPPVNDKFCPDDNVTRGQMAAFLVRALGYTDVGVGNLFTDDDNSVFENAIDKLGTAGVTKGCNPPANTKFCPDDNVTRGQMAAFLVRAFAYADDGGGDLFVDDDSSVFEGAIDKLATAGVTKGCNPPTNTMFCPDDLVTRGQMARFLRRALGLDLIVPPPPSTTTTTPTTTTTAQQGSVEIFLSTTGGTLWTGTAGSDSVSLSTVGGTLWTGNIGSDSVSLSAVGDTIWSGNIGSDFVFLSAVGDTIWSGRIGSDSVFLSGVGGIIWTGNIGSDSVFLSAVGDTIWRGNGPSAAAALIPTLFAP